MGVATPHGARRRRLGLQQASTALRVWQRPAMSSASFWSNCVPWTRNHFWLKKKSVACASIGGMVKARKQAQRQRRLLMRLTVSVDTLLRLQYHWPCSDYKQSLPIKPSSVLALLRQLSQGVDPADLIEDQIKSQGLPDETSLDRLSAVSSDG